MSSCHLAPQAAIARQQRPQQSAPMTTPFASGAGTLALPAGGQPGLLGSSGAYARVAHGVPAGNGLQPPVGMPPQQPQHQMLLQPQPLQQHQHHLQQQTPPQQQQGYQSVALLQRPLPGAHAPLPFASFLSPATSHHHFDIINGIPDKVFPSCSA